MIDGIACMMVSECAWIDPELLDLGALNAAKAVSK